MKLSLEIDGPLESQVVEAARRLNLSPEALATVALRDLVARTEDDFDSIARRVLEKNQELYKRLA